MDPSDASVESATTMVGRDSANRWTASCPSWRIFVCCGVSTDRLTIPCRPNGSITVEDLLTFRLGWGVVVAPPGKHPIQRAIAELGIAGSFDPQDNPYQITKRYLIAARFLRAQSILLRSRR